MYNTLTVRVYGMIKSKRPQKENQDADDEMVE
jgi:hypothetical protein